MASDYLRICLVSQEYPPDTGWGGIGTYTRILAQGLTRYGHSVHVIARSTMPYEYTYSDGDVKVHRIGQPVFSASVRLHDTSSIYQVLYGQRVSDKIHALDAAFGFDVVECPEFGAEAYTLSLTPREFALVIRLHTPTFLSDMYNGRPRTQGNLIMDMLEQVPCKVADLITAPSRTVTAAVSDHWDIGDSEVIVIPNPVDIDIFIPRNPGDKRLSPYPTILYVGRMERLKGVEQLVRSIPYVLQDVPEARFVFIGRDTATGPKGTSFFDFISRLVNILGIPRRNIRFIDQLPREQLIRHYQESDLCVFPSLYENLPYTALEAMSCGKPIVIPSNIGLAEYITDSEDGFYVDGTFPREIAECIVRAISDRPRLEAVGYQARGLIERRFSVDAVVPRMIDVYQRAIERKRASASKEKAMINARSPLSISESGAQGDNTWNPSLSILILTYNALEYTKRCVLSLLSSTKFPFNIYILDNGSTDGTREWLGTLSSESRVHVLVSEKNLGVPGGRNHLLKNADLGDIVVFLDNDVEVFQGWDERLLRVFLSRDDIGIVGVSGHDIKVVDGSRDLHPVQCTGAPRQCDIVVGFCMALRSRLIKEIGLFDEELGPFWHEDDDYCVKAMGLGYKNFVVPDVPIIHYEHKSSSTKPSILSLERSKRNLEYLCLKWKSLGIINREGRPQRAGSVRVVWEGPQTPKSPMGLINREICQRIQSLGAIDLSVRESKPTDPSDVTAITDIEAHEAPKRNPMMPAEMHIRHQWLLDPRPPEEGRWAAYQPWEFSSIPKSWVLPLRELTDEIWVPNSFTKQSYVESGIPEGKIHVIPYGVDPAMYHPGIKPLTLDTAKAFRFLFIGNITYLRGIDILLRAYTRGFSRNDDVCLVIRDTGEDIPYQTSSLRNYMSELQSRPDCPEILFLTGDTSEAEMACLYAACNCLVYPYRSESSAIRVAEAMACGRPVISTKHGPVVEFCSAETGYLVTANIKPLKDKAVGGLRTVDYPTLAEVDEDELIAIMRHVVDHPDEVMAMGVRASAAVLANLTWERTSAKIVGRILNIRGRAIKREELAHPERIRPTLVRSDPAYIETSKLVRFAATPSSIGDLCKILGAWADAFDSNDEIALVLAFDEPLWGNAEEISATMQRMADALDWLEGNSPEICIISANLGRDARMAIFGAVDVLIDPGDCLYTGEARFCGCEIVPLGNRDSLQSSYVRLLREKLSSRYGEKAHSCIFD